MTEVRGSARISTLKGAGSRLKMSLNSLFIFLFLTWSFSLCESSSQCGRCDSLSEAEFVSDILTTTHDCDDSGSSSEPVTFFPVDIPSRNTLNVTVSCHRDSCFLLVVMNVTDVGYSRVGDGEEVSSHRAFCNETVSIPHLSPGKYSVLSFEFGYQTKEPSERCLCAHTRPWVFHAIMEAPEVKIASSQMVDHAERLFHGALVYTSLGVGCLLLAVAIGCAVLVIRRRGCKSRHMLPVPSVAPLEEKLQPLSQALATRAPAKVLILAAHDCQHHARVVEALARFMQANNCQVHYEAWDKEKMAVNKVSYLAEKLSGGHKVLWVSSRRAFQLQQVWLQSGAVQRLKVSSEEQLFQQALALIMHRPEVHFGYNSLFVLRPNYVNGHFLPVDMCPGRHYVVAQQLGQLLCHIHQLEASRVRVDDWSHCALAHSHLLQAVADVEERKSACVHCQQQQML